MNAATRRNWWHHPAVVTIAMLFWLFPLGLLLLWTAPYRLRWKWGITLFIVGLTVLGVVLFVAVDGDPASAPVMTSETPVAVR